MAKIVKLNQQISLDDALHRIARKCQDQPSPYHCASYRLSVAILCATIRLYVDGILVNPNFFACTLYCYSEQDEAGGWHAHINTRAALERPIEEYSWTVSLIDVRRFVSNGARVSSDL
jgi:hypothetical protein